MPHSDPSKETLIREIRRLFLKREPMNITAVKRRHPELVARVYALRPFWGWKQALADAGIDYAKVNVELTEYCACLICGAEYPSIVTHVPRLHQMTCEEYRKEFPDAELMSETLRALHRKGKPAIPHWEPVWSWEYVLDRAWEFHRRGWSLNVLAVHKREPSLHGIVWNNGRQWDEVLQALGLDAARVRKVQIPQRLSETDVVRRLKRRFREGKSLASSFVLKDEKPLLWAARRLFGGYAAALRAAGFDREKVQIRKQKITPVHIAELGAELRRIKSLHGHERASAARTFKRRYTSTANKHLGGLRKAYQKFGIKPQDMALHPYATKEHVIEGLRRWARVPGASWTRIRREDKVLTQVAYKLFGGWSKALKAAGVRLNSLTSNKSRRVFLRT